MHRIVCPTNHIDNRGSITDLIVETVDAITRVSFVKGAKRGNHVHKMTTQWCLVLSGKIRVSTIVNEILCTEIFLPGDLLVSLPNEPHAFEALEESEILVFTSGPRQSNDFHKDTYPVAII